MADVAPINWIFDQAKLPSVGTEVLLACQWQQTDRVVLLLARMAQFDPARARRHVARSPRQPCEPYMAWQSTWDGKELSSDFHPVAFAFLTEPRWQERRR